MGENLMFCGCCRLIWVCNAVDFELKVIGNDDSGIVEIAVGCNKRRKNGDLIGLLLSKNSWVGVACCNDCLV